MEHADSAAAWIDRVAKRFEAAELHYGHGTDNPRDEAAWLVLHCLGASLDGSFEDWGRPVGSAQARRIERIAEARCETRRPLAYLLGNAWFAGLEFEVGPEALVPRSPMAELILDGFRPWLRPDRVRRVLDLCTGGGCIAVATAHYLPEATVDALDISPSALALVERNAVRHGVGQRVRLLRSDLFEDLPRKLYDLILANPPYVPEAQIARLPGEYRAEPALGLASGADGLDATLDILARAADYLGDGGVLICEVGESEQRLAALLPGLPFLWLEFARGGSGVFLLERAQLESARGAVDAVIGERKNVA